MKLKVSLKSLIGSTFRFYIKDDYRSYLFTLLKKKYKNWGFVAKILNLNVRNLFGIRRGWELRESKKALFLISSRKIDKISRLLDISLERIEKNINYIKHGQSCIISRIKLPLVLDTERLKANSIYAALFDYEYAKNYLKKLGYNHLNRCRKLVIKPQVTKDYIDELKRRGLCPNFSNNYLSYRIPGSNRIKEVYIPKSLVFDENFAKQFGKWIGDRCGGVRKIGVANKNYLFIKEFEKFIKNKLKQDKYDLYLTCNTKFRPNEYLKRLVHKVTISNTQYGDYAFRIETSNALLKREVFDFIENNLMKILLTSKKEIRYAYYAGLIEAEGSIDKDNTITIASGINLGKSRKYSEFLEKLNKVLGLYYLLRLDGFNPRISRKVSHSTIKYDIVLLTSYKKRLKEVNFIKKTIYPFITHNEKLKKILYLEGMLKKEQIKMNNIQPELNIGLVGH